MNFPYGESDDKPDLGLIALKQSGKFPVGARFLTNMGKNHLGREETLEGYRQRGLQILVLDDLGFSRDGKQLPETDAIAEYPVKK